MPAMNSIAPPRHDPADLALQDHLLQGVSRTFALTIPQLPAELRVVVGNAYLLCRIADTIEDDPALSLADKNAFSRRFIAVVEGGESSADFRHDLAPRLGGTVSPQERELIQAIPAVARVTHARAAQEQAELVRCIRIMAEGMAVFQRNAGIGGLADDVALDRYCYVVAGVVGELLTELFIHLDPRLAPQREMLMPLAVSFGQGLQMTNILKDFWEDRGRGACWLPRDRFARHGVDLAAESWDRAAFSEALGELIGVARGHLANALRYLQRIPRDQTGIRRFCAWAVGMAVLTLRKLDQHREYQSGLEVKISRRAVRATIWTCNRCLASNRALAFLFTTMTRRLPPPEKTP